MIKDQATPRPWHTGRGLLVPDWCIYDKENNLVLSFEETEEGKANARLIVKVVNCHDELVGALKNTIELLKFVSDGSKTMKDDIAYYEQVLVRAGE